MLAEQPKKLKNMIKTEERHTINASCGNGKPNEVYAAGVKGVRQFDRVGTQRCDQVRKRREVLRIASLY